MSQQVAAAGLLHLGLDAEAGLGLVAAQVRDHQKIPGLHTGKKIIGNPLPFCAHNHQGSSSTRGHLKSGHL